MARKKIRVKLGLHRPLAFKNSLLLKNDPRWTLELKDFSITPDRCEWTIKLGDGSLIEGRLGDRKPLPALYWPGSEICLHIPVVLHQRRSAASCEVEFIVWVPSEVVPLFEGG